MGLTPFRRAGTELGAVFIETGDGIIYHLPNPTAGGRVYDAGKTLQAVIKARAVNLEHWTRRKDHETVKT